MSGGLRVVYLNLNEPPHLPVDGGRTSIPHVHLALDGDDPVGILVVSERKIIDMVYVAPDARGRGIAGVLYVDAKARHGRIGTDDRLSADGVAFARRYRVPLYGATRRKATLDAATTERNGADALARAVVSYRHAFRSGSAHE